MTTHRVLNVLTGPGMLAKVSAAIDEGGLAALAPRLARGLVHRLIFRPVDGRLDRLIGANTDGKVSAADLAVGGPNGRFGLEYAATPGLLFQMMVASLRIDPRRYSFVDVGSGKGRLVCLASLLPFRQVFGVEFSRVLHEAASANVAALAAAGAARCPDTRCLHMDATEFAVPTTDCVVFLYNPFLEPVLTRVVENLRASHARHGQKIFVIYYNPQQRHVLDASGFLKPRRQGPLLRAAVAAGHHDLALYET